MKTYFSFLCIALAATVPSLLKAQVVEKPTVVSRNTFAIVIDLKTHDKIKDVVRGYKKAVEADGLGTYILAKNWTGPEEIREELFKLYNQQPKLEGAVFIGDIPVPMVRDAQHLTSTFKMDQEFEWISSSVPSDRYYDDFDLKFRFIKRDSAQSLCYYYSLLPASAQRLQPDIYTARIKPPKTTDADFVKSIESYLKKAISEKEKVRKIRNASIYTGYGSFTESINSYAGEQVSIRDQFPAMYRPGGYIKFLSFRNHPYMKFNLLSEMQRKELDLFIFHGHGLDTTQYVNGVAYANEMNGSVANSRMYLRNAIRTAFEKGKDTVKVKQELMDKWKVQSAWVDDAFVPAVRVADSIHDDNLHIYPLDMMKMPPNAKLILLDACFNGAFQHDKYIAGFYPFTNGDNILTIANSIGVLQDMWPTEMMGLLQYGVRAGNLFKETMYLETHLFGDPTFRFSNEGKTDLDDLISNKRNATVIWETLLKQDQADIQCLALRMIVARKKQAASGLLKQTYFGSKSSLVRLEALKLLAEINNADFYTVLKASVKDPSEVVRRMTAFYIGESGNSSMIPVLIELMITDRHSERVDFKSRHALTLMNPDSVMAVAAASVSKYEFFEDKEKFTADLMSTAKEIKRRQVRDMGTILDKTQKPKSRLMEITTLRTYHYHTQVPGLIAVARDQQDDHAVRMAAIEALGWYPASLTKQQIVAACNSIIENKSNAEPIRNQALKTRNRLNAW